MYETLSKKTLDSKQLKAFYHQLARINRRAHSPNLSQYFGAFFFSGSKQVSFSAKASLINTVFDKIAEDEQRITEALKDHGSALYKALNLSTIFAVNKTKAIKEIESNNGTCGVPII